MKRSIPMLLIVLLLLPACASAVSFEITDYLMKVRVEPSGAAAFEETVEYAFTGEYNGMLASIRYSEDALPADLRIYVDGDTELTRVGALEGTPNTFVAETENGVMSIRAYTPGNDGTRAFRMTYSKEGFARRYQDIGYIDQTLLIAEYDYQSATIRVGLPGQDNEAVVVTADGGTLAGSFWMQDGVLTFGPQSVAEGEVLSVRAQFPAEWLSEAPAAPERLLDMMEAQQAEEVAAQREAEAQNRTSIYVLMGTFLIYCLGFSLVFYRQKETFGLRRRVEPVTDDALLSEIPVAIAQLLRSKSVSSSALSASLMELAGMGLLTMRSENDDTCFSPVRSKELPYELWPHQRQLFGWLFKKQEDLWMNTLDAGDDRQAAKEFTRRYNDWKSVVMEDAVNAGWVYDNGTKRVLLTAGSLALGLFLAQLLLSVDGSNLLAPLAAVTAVVFCVGFARLRRLSDEGEKRLAALEGFIRNYDDLLAREPGTVIGRAPLAMALGYMEPLVNWIDRNGELPYDAFPEGAPAWIYSDWHHAAMRMERMTRLAQSHNAGVSEGIMQGDQGIPGGMDTGGGSSGGSSHGAW